MTATTEEQTATRPEPMFVFDGHLRCDFCDARYDYTLVEGSKLTSRQQLRQAAERQGWRHTVAGLEVCPDDAKGPARILIERFLLVWGQESAQVPQQAGPAEVDSEQTLTIPAVVEREPEIAHTGRHPYAEAAES